jgi:hypothetical protein
MTTFYSGTLIVCVFEMMKVWMAIATSYFENKQVKSSSLLSYLNQNLPLWSNNSLLYNCNYGESVKFVYHLADFD